MQMQCKLKWRELAFKVKVTHYPEHDFQLVFAVKSSTQTTVDCNKGSVQHQANAISSTGQGIPLVHSNQRLLGIRQPVSSPKLTQQVSGVLRMGVMSLTVR